MKVSYNWLNGYFDGKLPPPEKIAEELTFHAWEIEDIEKVGDDTILDVKVLPDKAMWALSHRGVAKDVSAILNLPLAKDPLGGVPELAPSTTKVEIKLETPKCRRFAAALITNVKVGPSPDWLRTALEAIGQRSINNIVDASNYVMFDLGQPTHAFDAAKLPGGLLVRQAKSGEKLAALDDNEYTFTEEDTLISTLDGRALSIAGIKGGKESGISEATTDILIEAASWDSVAVRKTASHLKLRSDASSRYENGLVPEMVPHGLQAVVALILQVAGGELAGYAQVGAKEPDQRKVTVTLAKVNSVLGTELTEAELTSVLKKFGWSFTVENASFTITSPFERTDLVIPEDLIEEVGRIYGYDHVEAIKPETISVAEVNQRFYYTEQIRAALTSQGFSEIYTTSFREHDAVKMTNAFAADKGYLRSSLASNMRESLMKNLPHADLLGLRQIRLFEIGTVFNDDGERFMLALGVHSPSGYKAKLDDPVLAEALRAVTAITGGEIASPKNGVIELDLGALLEKLPTPEAYAPAPLPLKVSYQPFSVYPAVSRDIAMWVGSGETESDIETLLREKAGELCVRVTLFDRFQKDDRVSYAYRLVFQSKEKTLTGGEVDAIMDGVYQAVRERGYEVR